MRTPEEFKRQAEVKEITFWPLHDCSMCGATVGTEIRYGQASYNSSCGCGSSPNHSPGWESVAERYNMQRDEDVIAAMDEFWGFDKKKDA